MSRTGTAHQELPTVSVGIAAYNEAANIEALLEALLRQRSEGFRLESISVVSDGSTDATDEIVRGVAARESRVRLFVDGARRGKPERLNEMLRRASTDIIILLDADILLEHDGVLEAIVNTFLRDPAVMHVSGYALPLEPETVVERIAYMGTRVWEKARRSGAASPLYFSEGRVQAYRRALYETLGFPNRSADEAYAFLYSQSQGHAFAVAEAALVRYQLPTTVADAVKQMKRFLKSNSIQKGRFGCDFVKRYYTITNWTKFKALLATLIEEPLWTMLYVLFLPLPRLALLTDRRDAEGVWQILTTTKRLVSRTPARKRAVFSMYDELKNPWYGGGGALSLYEVTRRLTPDFEVTVVAGHYPSALREETIQGITYRRIGTGRLGPQVGQLIYWAILPWYALRLRYDIWVENLTPPFGPSLLPLFTRRPVIALVHMLPGMDMWRKYKIPFFVFEWLGLKCYRQFIVLSEQAKETIRRIAPRARFAIIPNGIDTPEILSRRAPKHILYIGRIEINQKGLDLLIEAYKQVAKKTHYPLYIAGPGVKAEKEKLEKLVAESGLADRIKLFDRVDGEEKSRLFEEAALVVVPSRFESFGLVALEALAYGVPAVTFDIEGFRWVPDELVKKATPFYANDLSEKKMEALSSESTALSEALRAFAAKYRWENVAASYKTFIEETLAQAAVPQPQRATSSGEHMDRILQDIVANRKPCFFVSPHLDDAILSAGGLLTYLANKTEVTVATVFTEAGSTSHTLSARQFLRQCQYTDANRLFADRRREDLEALGHIGVRAIHMGFSDALWRQRPRNSWWRRSLAGFLPEATALYPTYRLHISKGVIHPDDGVLLEALKLRLKALVAGHEEYYVFCPQAIGSHTDHVIVHRVCEEAFPRVIEWSDFPYNLKVETKSDQAWAWNENQDEKKHLILAYKTQVKPMFGDAAVPIIPELYQVSNSSL